MQRVFSSFSSDHIFENPTLLLVLEINGKQLGIVKNLETDCRHLNNVSDKISVSRTNSSGSGTEKVRVGLGRNFRVSKGFFGNHACVLNYQDMETFGNKLVFYLESIPYFCLGIGLTHLYVLFL